MIEIDDVHGVAQVRSAEPVDRQDTLKFFELRLQQNHRLQLDQQIWNKKAQKRYTTPFLMLEDQFMEMVGRLVELY